ncbi:Vacuolar protein-sorting-associated protein 27 [Chytridiales sp. JEL 0842]|nr:Vacuolar protein-sorting-associated protein 27 [Chytridiales sp. JEL 0842]
MGESPEDPGHVLHPLYRGGRPKQKPDSVKRQVYNDPRYAPFVEEFRRYQANRDSWVLGAQPSLLNEPDTSPEVSPPPPPSQQALQRRFLQPTEKWGCSVIKSSIKTVMTVYADRVGLQEKIVDIMETFDWVRSVVKVFQNFFILRELAENKIFPMTQDVTRLFWNAVIGYKPPKDARLLKAWADFERMVLPEDQKNLLADLRHGRTKDLKERRTVLAQLGRQSANVDEANLRLHISRNLRKRLKDYFKLRLTSLSLGLSKQEATSGAERMLAYFQYDEKRAYAIATAAKEDPPQPPVWTKAPWKDLNKVAPFKELSKADVKRVELVLEEVEGWHARTAFHWMEGYRNLPIYDSRFQSDPNGNGKDESFEYWEMWVLMLRAQAATSVFDTEENEDEEDCVTDHVPAWVIDEWIELYLEKSKAGDFEDLEVDANAESKPTLSNKMRKNLKAQISRCSHIRTVAAEANLERVAGMTFRQMAFFQILVNEARNAIEQGTFSKPLRKPKAQPKQTTIRKLGYALVPEANYSVHNHTITTTILIYMAFYFDKDGFRQRLEHQYPRKSLQSPQAVEDARMTLEDFEDFLWSLFFNVSLLDGVGVNGKLFDYAVTTNGFYGSFICKHPVPKSKPAKLTPATVALTPDTVLGFVDLGRVDLTSTVFSKRKQDGVVSRCPPDPPSTPKPESSASMLPPVSMTRLQKRGAKKLRHEKNLAARQRIAADDASNAQYLAKLDQQSKRHFNGNLSMPPSLEESTRMLTTLVERSNRRLPTLPSPQKGVAFFDDKVKKATDNEDVEYAFSIPLKEYRSLAGLDVSEATRRKVDVEATFQLNGDIVNLTTLLSSFPTKRTLNLERYSAYGRKFLLEFPQLYRHYRQNVHLEFAQYRQQQRVWRYIGGMFQGNHKRDDVVVVVGDAKFSSSGKGGRSAPTARIKRELNKYVQLIQISEFRSTITCSGCQLEGQRDPEDNKTFLGVHDGVDCRRLSPNAAIDGYLHVDDKILLSLDAMEAQYQAIGQAKQDPDFVVAVNDLVQAIEAKESLVLDVAGDGWEGTGEDLRDDNDEVDLDEFKGVEQKITLSLSPTPSDFQPVKKGGGAGEVEGSRTAGYAGGYRYWEREVLGDVWEKATSENLPIGTEDLVLNLEIADKIKSKEVLPKEAIRALKKRINHKNPNVQLMALKLTDTCVKNSGHHFLVEVASRDFIDNMVSIAGQFTGINPEVRQKVLALIQSWGLAFKGKHDLSYVSQVYENLKREGVPFPPVESAEASAIMIDTTTVIIFFSTKWMLKLIPSLNDIGTIMDRKRHHCRNCGMTCCHACSSKQMKLPHLGISQDVRVCDGCHLKLTTQSSNPSTPNLGRAASVKTGSGRSAVNDEAKREQEELEKAIQASLAESSKYQTKSTPRPVSNTRAQVVNDEEEDEDLKAAIAASLNELKISEEKQPVENPNQLSRLEIDNLKLFADLVERMEADVNARGIGVMSHSQISSLYTQLITLQPKLMYSLDDAVAKYRESVGLNDKLTGALQLYDRMLQDRLNAISGYTPAAQQTHYNIPQIHHQAPPTEYIAPTPHAGPVAHQPAEPMLDNVPPPSASPPQQFAYHASPSQHAQPWGGFGTTQAPPSSVPPRDQPQAPYAGYGPNQHYGGQIPSEPQYMPPPPSQMVPIQQAAPISESLKDLQDLSFDIPPAPSQQIPPRPSSDFQQVPSIQAESTSQQQPFPTEPSIHGDSAPSGSIPPLESAPPGQIPIQASAPAPSPIQQYLYSHTPDYAPEASGFTPPHGLGVSDGSQPGQNLDPNFVTYSAAGGPQNQQQSGLVAAPGRSVPAAKEELALIEF